MPDLITKEDFEAQITTNFDATFSENINQIVSQVKLLVKAHLLSKCAF